MSMPLRLSETAILALALASRAHALCVAPERRPNMFRPLDGGMYFDGLPAVFRLDDNPGRDGGRTAVSRGQHEHAPCKDR